MRKVRCYSCGDEYAQIALHWNGKECGWPEFSEKQIEIMKGLLLGDADIKEGTNGSIFRLRMTNKRFLEWVSTKLSPLSRGTFLSETSEEQKKSALRGGLEGVSECSTFNDLYGVRTITHPQVNQLYDWYSSGKKRYPSEITREMLRMWYVTDGNIHPGGMRLTCNAQLDKRNEVEKMLRTVECINSVSFNKGGTITISNEDSKYFWRNTSPPPGFEYKWK